MSDILTTKYLQKTKMNDDPIQSTKFSKLNNGNSIFTNNNNKTINNVDNDLEQFNYSNQYESYLSNLNCTERYRILPNYNKQNNNFIDFSTNDYLNLSNNKDILHATYDSSLEYGLGSTGSRLLSGNNKIFENLETQIAKDKHTESALIFNTGYQANVSVLSSLCNYSVLKKQAIIFFDKLNHSSLYQAAFLSNAKLIRYSHNNMQHLEQLLEKQADNSNPKFIVSETLYGMDGDIPSLTTLINLTKKYNAFLYLDEAHATGLYGPRGYGFSTLHNLANIPHLIMGTFSKGIGAFGAYVACSKTIKNYLINKCPGFIYTTSLPPIIIKAVSIAWDKVQFLNKERKTLQENSQYLRNSLKKLNFNTGNSQSHIIPIIFGDEKKTLQACEYLKYNGILVSAVRPPTVPPHTSRVRIALTAKHKMEDIQKLIETISKY